MKLPVDGEIDRLPLSVVAPLQAPLAVHDAVRVDDQVKVELAPSVMVAGDNEMLMAGAFTTKVTDRLAEPPAPVQVRV